jgi:hypothetical protein
MLAMRYKTEKGTVGMSTDSSGDKVLRLQINDVLSAGGGARSGPTAIIIVAAQLDGEQVTYTTKISE